MIRTPDSHAGVLPPATPTPALEEVRADGHRGTRPVWTAGKRGFDVALSLVLLVVLTPLFMVVAVVLRRDSPGPVIFRQQRCGRGGRTFTVLKFRTMRTGVSSELHQRYIEGLARGECSADSVQKLVDDPRVTRAGAFLRRTSLDELPQLVNVVKGEMSIIGPRPALEYELSHYAPHHFERFGVRPGLTGLWQVAGRSGLGFNEMLDLDVIYARDAGPRLDAEILIKTPVALLRNRAV